MFQSLLVDSIHFTGELTVLALDHSDGKSANGVGDGALQSRLSQPFEDEVGNPR